MTKQIQTVDRVIGRTKKAMICGEEVRVSDLDPCFIDDVSESQAQQEAEARLNLLNEVRGLVEGMRERECFCNSCYSRTVIKGKPTRSPHCENSGYDTALDDLLSELNKLETTGQEEV